MSALKSDNYREFRIKKPADVLGMSRELRDETVKAYIAQELATNMLDAGEQGRILVNGVEVISEVKSNAGHKISESIEMARRACQSNTYNSNRGFAFISILKANWDIVVREVSSDLLQIICRKEPVCEVRH